MLKELLHDRFGDPATAVAMGMMFPINNQACGAVLVNNARQRRHPQHTVWSLHPAHYGYRVSASLSAHDAMQLGMLVKYFPNDVHQSSLSWVSPESRVEGGARLGFVAGIAPVHSEAERVALEVCTSADLTTRWSSLRVEPSSGRNFPRSRGGRLRRIYSVDRIESGLLRSHHADTEQARGAADRAPPRACAADYGITDG
jgi:hypothetical protein